MRLIAKGSTSIIDYVVIRDTSGAPKTGLTYSSMTGYYTRAGAATTSFSVVTQTTTGAFSSGGFVEMDATHAPGLYRIDPPNALYSSGVDTVVLSLTATGCDPCQKQYMLTGPDLTIVPGSANALFIAGTNAATTITSSGGSALTLSSTGSNGSGLAASGNGSGAGISATAGSTGSGILATGGASSGVGILGAGAGGNSSGIRGTGFGTGSGFYGVGGATGPGITGEGGATSGAGIQATGIAGNSPGVNLIGQGSSSGLVTTGGATGHGINAVGGATSGNGIRASGTAGNSQGVYFLGQGSASGLRAEGGATGNGFYGVGGATSGKGFYTTNDAAAVSGTLVSQGTGTDQITLTSARVDVGKFGGTAGTFASGVPDVNLATWKGTAPNALISGRVDSNPGALQSGVITSTSIATDAITSTGLAASAASEIATAVGALTVESSDSRTLKEAIDIAYCVLAGQTSNSGNTIKTPDGSATRVAVTVGTNVRTASTVTPSA